MKKSLALFLGCLLPWIAVAQISLSGQVLDAASQQPLIGSTVSLSPGNQATVSDVDGRYNFNNLSAGNYTVQVSYLGYTSVQKTITLPSAQSLNFALNRSSVTSREVLVTATRANEKTGTTYTNLSKEELESRNFGQDLPYLLDHTPSLVTNSDAGAGVGYTNMRIRGSDITRINVTVNGIPVNDPESHGVFFVNMPDFTTSVQEVQIQRGVGTSTNGAGAFGASINLQTIDTNPNAYARTDNAFGSYNTWKNNVQFGTGLLNGKFAVDARLSRISSDGYIDRATSDLKSYYLSGGFQGEKDRLKLVLFGGKEVTYQAWNGVTEDLLKTNRTYNSAGTAKSETAPYQNEVDDYSQSHYQLHYGHDFSSALLLNAALHYTRGFGFYEQYKANRKLADYGIEPVSIGGATIKKSDLVRRKWLDNHFYGTTFSLQYNGPGKVSGVVGGSFNQYLGEHFGEVIWARFASTSEIDDRYYQNDADKTDVSAYAKAMWQATEKLGFFGDGHVRRISYALVGVDDDQRNVTSDKDYNFFNPKAGVTFAFTPQQNLYASVAVAHREPTRSDFTDRPVGDVAKPERMVDYEAGYRARQPVGEFSGHPLLLIADLTLFYMDYKDQLVLTGQQNDVGTALRTNVPESYRTGLELAAGLGLGEVARLSTNLAFSRNKIQQFTETLYLYDNPQDYNFVGVVENQYSNSTLAYSPSVITSTQLEVQPVSGLRFQLQYKTVSEQFLDNTASQNRRLRPYQVADARVFYTFKPLQWMKEVELGLLVNNIFNETYEANGGTYTELFLNNRNDTNYYYPQAPINFLSQISLRF